jgi:hypothetical protein
MDPLTILAGATTAFNLVKKAVQTGKEIEGIVGQLGKWFDAYENINRAAAEPKKSKFLGGGSAEEEALNIVVAQQKLKQQEYELKVLIIGAYGESAYYEMLRQRVRIKKERKEAKARADRKKDELVTTIAITVGGLLMAIALIVLFYIVFVYV